VKADPFSEGLAAVATVDTNKYGYINTKGEMVIPPKYEEAFYFNEGLAAVKILDKWGYIDKRNQWVIPARYKSAYNFEDGMA
ncbi:WG repeat-containing protein, partial [Neisseria sp. P0003.S004]